jgi:hypothetical protein
VPPAHDLAAVDVDLVRRGQAKFPGQRLGQPVLGYPGALDVDPEFPAT